MLTDRSNDWKKTYKHTCKRLTSFLRHNFAKNMKNWGDKKIWERENFINTSFRTTAILFVHFGVSPDTFLKVHLCCTRELQLTRQLIAFRPRMGTKYSLSEVAHLRTERHQSTVKLLDYTVLIYTLYCATLIDYVFSGWATWPTLSKYSGRLGPSPPVL